MSDQPQAVSVAGDPDASPAGEVPEVVLTWARGLAEYDREQCRLEAEDAQRQAEWRTQCEQRAVAAALQRDKPRILRDLAVTLGPDYGSPELRALDWRIDRSTLRYKQAGENLEVVPTRPTFGLGWEASVTPRVSIVAHVATEGGSAREQAWLEETQGVQDGPRVTFRLRTPGSEGPLNTVRDLASAVRRDLDRQHS